MSTPKYRREFLRQTVFGTLGACLVSESGQALAAKLSPFDPSAAKLGYLEDASKVDTKRYPTYKPGQTCANCMLIQMRYGPYRPCKLFPSNVVNAKGWCTAWVKKTYG